MNIVVLCACVYRLSSGGKIVGVGLIVQPIYCSLLVKWLQKKILTAISEMHLS